MDPRLANALKVLAPKRVTRPFGAALLALSIAFAAMAATPRSVCACSTKETAYVAAMKADLRNLIVAQEAYFADSGRLGTEREIFTPERFVFSTGVALASFLLRADGYDARVQYPSGTLRECWISVNTSPDGATVPYDPEPVCTPAPTDTRHLGFAIAYLVLFLIALAIRVARAGAGLNKVGIGTIAGFALLAVVHPFWQLRRAYDFCSPLRDLDVLSLILIAVVTARMALSEHEPEDRPAPA